MPSAACEAKSSAVGGLDLISLKTASSFGDSAELGGQDAGSGSRNSCLSLIFFSEVKAVL